MREPGGAAATAGRRRPKRRVLVRRPRPALAEPEHRADPLAGQHSRGLHPELQRGPPGSRRGPGRLHHAHLGGDAGKHLHRPVHRLVAGLAQGGGLQGGSRSRAVGALRRVLTRGPAPARALDLPLRQARRPARQGDPCDPGRRIAAADDHRRRPLPPMPIPSPTSNGGKTANTSSSNTTSEGTRSTGSSKSTPRPAGPGP